jgi:hypothetical protein
MRVCFRMPDLQTCSKHEAAYVSPTQLFLSVSRDYDAHAVSVYDGVSFLLVVDDKDTPVFLPRLLFEVLEPSIPRDWICNLFPCGPVQLVLGPAFLARDLVSYNAMVDQEAAQVENLWRRIESQRQEER